MAFQVLNNEKFILTKVSQGDHRAFCVLFDHYNGYVFNFGRKLTRSSELAEEIVQEIFMKIWKLREKLSEIENFEAYLTRLVQNQAYTVLRKNMLLSRVSTLLNKKSADENSDLGKELDYKETVRMLDEAIESLPSKQKQVYELCHKEGLKYNEVATVMKISPETVHYHMKLALKSIRQHFLDRSFLYPMVIVALFEIV